MRICNTHLEGVGKSREAYHLLGKTQEMVLGYKCKEKNIRGESSIIAKKPSKVAFFFFVLSS